MPLTVPNPVLDERWLKRAAWWTRHREQLQKVGLGAVMLVEALMLAGSGYVWVDYFLFNRKEEQRLYQELSQAVDFGSLHAIHAPQPITVLSAVTLPEAGPDGVHDVLVKFSNPNLNWLATVAYQFAADTNNGPVQEIFILNNEERFVIGPGAARSTNTAPEVSIVTVRWQRIKDLARFNERKPRFKVSDISFSPVTEKGRDGKSVVNRVNFTVTNESIFSFWSVGFTVVLLYNDRPVAARYTTLQEVRAGERREVSLNINTTISAVNKVLVASEVNIADTAVFMSLTGESIDF